MTLNAHGPTENQQTLLRKTNQLLTEKPHSFQGKFILLK
jgi:hypothetical protein